MMDLISRTIGILRARQVKINRPVTSGPDAVELILQGNACEDGGDYAAAIELYQQAVGVAPDLARAHLNLGNAFAGQGRTQQAITCYLRAIELQPDFLPAHLNLGANLLRKGDFAQAEAAYQVAVRLAPDSGQAWVGLGCALDDARSETAESTLRHALELTPQHAGAASRLAHLLRDRGRGYEALALLDTMLAKSPDDTVLLLAFGAIQQSVGNYAKARTAFKRARNIAPHDWNAWSSELWTLNFMLEAGPEQVLNEHRAFGDALVNVVTRGEMCVSRGRRQRLKVGYVSADFRRHSVACFIEPLLRHHDRTKFEVHCFYNFPTGDDVTRRLFALSDHWHDIADASDDAVARRVRDNGIDILVDLSGHTEHNRLAVFARKPAPLQCTWLGYLCTSGLATMDGRLCDPVTDPPGAAEDWQVEQPWRVSSSQWCYQPQVALPGPSDLPMARNGYWTFGSFNQESKLNSIVLDAWARVLHAVPNSRLRIVGVTCDVVTSRIRDSLSAAGIAEERLDLIGRLPIDEYLASYNDVDIALDTFPYNGATTTCDALLMGVPVAVVAGNRSIARGGASLLTQVELTDWIVQSPDALPELLHAQTSRPQRIETLRRELPKRMRESGLMNGAAFAREVEAVFSAAWERLQSS